MKTKNTKRSILSMFAVSATIFVSAKASQHFNKRALVSGTERRQGAVYRFPTVKCDVDALVTVDKLTRGATLNSFDFSGSGLISALQPELSIAPYCWGYVQFHIQFVKAGTSVPVVLSDIPRKGSNFGCNCKDVKLDVLSNSATSFKVRMYTVNRNEHTMKIKADVFLQKFTDESKLAS